MGMTAAPLDLSGNFLDTGDEGDVLPVNPEGRGAMTAAEACERVRRLYVMGRERCESC